MTEPDYKKLYEDAMNCLDVFLDRVSPEDIWGIDIEYTDTYQRALNLQKYRQTINGGTK